MDALKPPKFYPASENLAQTWRDYKTEFHVYLEAAGKMEVVDIQKIALLLYGMGKDYIKIYENFVCAKEGDKKKFKKIITHCDSYFEPKKLVKLYVTKFQMKL